jgi:uncharacterized membrane protein
LIENTPATPTPTNTMFLKFKEKFIYRIFEISLIIKAVDAVIEIVLAFLILFTDVISDVLTFLTRGELAEDPKDFLANLLLRFVPYVQSNPHSFIVFYLIAHGATKLFLVVAVLKEKLWAFPTYAVLLSVLVLFQIFKALSINSFILGILTVFDMVVIWLVLHEYELRKKKVLAAERA